MNVFVDPNKDNQNTQDLRQILNKDIVNIALTMINNLIGQIVKKEPTVIQNQVSETNEIIIPKIPNEVEDKKEI